MKKMILLAFGLLFSLPLQAGQAWLTFKAGEAWRVEETSNMMGAPYKAVMSYKVEKTYPDGSALVKTEFVSVESGPSFDKLKPMANSPMLGKHMYFLYTTSGLIYGLMEGDPSMPGMPDHVKDLKTAANTRAFMASSPSPRDRFQLPPKALVAGKTAKVDEDGQAWTIKRLSDAKVGTAKCQVYAGNGPGGSVQDSVWYDPAGKRVLYRVLSQGEGKEKQESRQRRY